MNHDLQAADKFLPKHKRKYVPGEGIKRYNIALKNLIPIRRNKNKEGTNAIDAAGFFSMVGMSWISKFMHRANKNGSKIDDLPSVSRYDACDYNADRFEILWREELARKGADKASFSMVVWRFCRTRTLIASLIHTFSIIFGILSHSLFLQKLLEYVQAGGGSYIEGIKWVILLTSFDMLRRIFLGWSNLMNYRTGVRLRSACLTLVYRKIIGVNNLQKNNIGEVINIFSNDAQRIFDLLANGPMIIRAPITTIFVVFYILSVLSPIALLGIVTLLLFYAIQLTMSRLVRYFQTRAAKLSDTRISLMNEILDSVKLIKMYAWEKCFSDNLKSIRKKELSLLLKTSYCMGVNSSMTQVMPGISPIVMLLAHSSAGNTLTAAKAFPCVLVIETRLRMAMVHFRNALESIILAGISFDRIKKVLLLEDDECLILKPIHESQAFAITNGTFAYNIFEDNKKENSMANKKMQKKEHLGEEDESEKEKLNKPKINADHVEILFDISFEAEKGKLVGICGTVGSGKSSLLLTALGQLRVSAGQVTRDGECAYVSQQAWITNATLRENILFGAKFEEKRYNETIEACSLIQDIDMFPGGDQTEIGEKGINLSGGQKQRVALARALYANRDIYLLDDPLSAVDSRVGSDIFNHLILGALKEKTVIFVTHQIQYLNRCDDVYMMRDGRIVEHGTHDELMKLGNEYASMVTAIPVNNENVKNTPEDLKISTIHELGDDISLQTTDQSHPISPKSNDTNGDTKKELTATAVPGASLTVADELRQGTTKLRIYHSYIVAAGGYCVTFMIMCMFCLAAVSLASSSWWLALWIEAGGEANTTVKSTTRLPLVDVNDDPDPWYYYTIYAWMIVGILVTNTLRSAVLSQATVRASTRLHNNLFNKIIDSPMRFFDTTPLGRIQHLFSRDMDEVDVMLPSTLSSCTVIATRMMIFVLITCLVFPWFILACCLLGITYYYVSKVFRVAISGLKSIENKSRAPVISHVTATIQGLNTIHAFGKEEDFLAKFMNLFDENSKFQFLFNIGSNWLEIRIDALSVATISFTALLVIFLQDQIGAATAGVVFSYAVQIGGVLPFLGTAMTQTDARFNSVERVNHYIKTVQREGQAKQSTVKPPSIWPTAVKIKFMNVSMAYGEGTPLILKNVSFDVHAGEKIGIVGRTGSGKSSLTVALFRLVELTEGKIEIDDVDISEISLNKLRSKLSIIPQDPVLFSGTVRSNLDPFKLYTDAEIWDALEKTELKSRVQTLAGQLDASVGFGGDNMSVGERQLLCLARALLRNSKILVLDEATAAVDPETEIAVQNTVQREFSQCTILTIAHRLQTVVSLNRILVMDDGEVLEFDTPENLLADTNSQFSKMMTAAEHAANR